jgi:hypothetical protein
MRIARHAPLLLGALLVVRIMACTGGSADKPGTGGKGGASAPSGACVNGNVTYTSSDGGTQTHTCPYQDCWVDVATGSASCMRPDTSDVRPFRTCRSASDCSGATYCADWGDSYAMQLGAASCVDGVCDWATETAQACTGGQLCWPSSCATVATGTTSGGFPWTTGQGGTCAGAGCGQGVGGQGGTTGGGGGGQSGTTGGAGGGAGAPGACVSGDVSAVGASWTHACPNHDCWIDAATGSASCMTTNQAGTPPFRTCLTATDCAGATYCAVLAGASQVLLGTPACTNGICEWASQMETSCPSAYRCFQYGCTVSGTAGTTSGGFPWGGAGGN